MHFAILVPKLLVKPMLWFSKFFKDETAVLACKGYGDDWEYYTGLYWDEDYDIDVNWYTDYELWVNLKIAPNKT